MATNDNTRYDSDGYLDDYEIAKREIIQEKSRNRAPRAARPKAPQAAPRRGGGVFMPRGGGFSAPTWLKSWKTWSGAAIALFAVGLAVLIVQNVWAEDKEYYWVENKFYTTYDGTNFSGEITAEEGGERDFAFNPSDGDRNTVYIFADSYGDLKIPAGVTVEIVGGKTEGGAVVEETSLITSDVTAASTPFEFYLADNATVEWKAKYASTRTGQDNSTLLIWYNGNGGSAAFNLADGAEIRNTAESNGRTIGLYNSTYYQGKVSVGMGAAALVSASSDAFTGNSNVNSSITVTGEAQIVGSVSYVAIDITEDGKLTVGETASETLGLDATATLTNEGNITVGQYGTLNFSVLENEEGAQITNSGNILFRNTTNGGTITNNAGAIITVSGLIENNGTITNNSEVSIAADNDEIPPVLAKSGFTLMPGGSLKNNDGTFINNGTLDMYTNDSGAGQFLTNTGTFTNTGTITVTKGTLTATSLDAENTVSGIFTNSGTISIAATGQLATATIIGGTITNADATNANITITPVAAVIGAENSQLEGKTYEWAKIEAEEEEIEELSVELEYDPSNEDGDGYNAAYSNEVTYQWYTYDSDTSNFTADDLKKFDDPTGDNFPTGVEVIEGENGANYTPAFAKGDEGSFYYFCVVTNAVGVGGDTATGYRHTLSAIVTIEIVPVMYEVADPTSVDESENAISPSPAPSASPDRQKAGGMVTLTASDDEENGYRFLNFVVKDGDNAEVEVTGSNGSYTFEMPSSEVTIVAHYAKEYAITATTATNGSYTVTTDYYPTSAAKAIAGETVTLTATPETGYKFAGWTVTDAGNNDVTLTYPAEEVFSPATFTMPASAVTIEATFEKLPEDDYNITIAADPTAGGTATVSPASAQGSSTIATLTLTATPNPGYAFKGFTTTNSTLQATIEGLTATDSDGTYTATATDITMPSAALALTAEFELIDYSINTAAIGDDEADLTSAANVTATGPESKTADFHIGDVITLSAEAEVDVGDSTTYEFTNWTITNDDSSSADITNTIEWTGGKSANDREATFNMYLANITVTAHYETKEDQGTDPPLYDITATSSNDEHGTLTVLVNGAAATKAKESDTITLTATPKTGYEFAYWAWGESGSPTPPTGVTLSESGTKAKLSEEDSAAWIATFAMPAADVTAQAVFRAIPKLTLAANEYGVLGVISVGTQGNVVNDWSSPVPVPSGTTVWLNASAMEKDGAPDPGYQFSLWQNGSTPELWQQSAETSFSMPENDYALTATFGRCNVSLTVATNPVSGFGTAGGSTEEGGPYQTALTVPYGDTVYLTATGANNFEFTGWSSTSTAVAFADADEAETSFTMPYEAGGLTVTAAFEQIVSQLTVNFTATEGSVTINNAPATSGTAVDINAGAEVILSASSESGYKFTKWTSSSKYDNGEDIITTANEELSSLSLTMPAGNIVISAVFEEYTVPVGNYPVVVRQVDEDSVVGTYGIINQSKTDEAVGETITLTVTPAAGYAFKEWTGEAMTTAVAGSGSPYTYTVVAADDADGDGTITLTAVFAVVSDYRITKFESYNWQRDIIMDTVIDPAETVTAEKVVGATRTPIEVGVTPLSQYDNIALSADEPPEGMTFVSFEVYRGTPSESVYLNNNAAARTATFIMPAASVTVRANYNPAQRSVNATATAGGTVQMYLNGGTTSVNAATTYVGDQVRLVATPTPETDYGFAGWTVTAPTEGDLYDEIMADKTGTLEFTMPNYPITLQARFSTNVEPLAESKFTFAGTGEGTLTARNVTADTPIVSGDTNITEGQKVELTVTPAAGHVLDGALTWDWGASGQPTGANYTESGDGTNASPLVVTFTMPANAVSVSAVFGEDEEDDTPYSITANSVNEITGVIPGSYTVTNADGIAITEATAKTPVTLTATEVDGYEFVSWEVTQAVTWATGSSATAPTATFTMPASNVTITATFKTSPLLTVTDDGNAGASGGVTKVTVGSVDATLPVSGLAVRTNTGVSVTAAEAGKTGYEFAGWMKSGTPEANFFDDAKALTAKFTMPGTTTTITANYAPKKYSLTVHPSPLQGGSVSGQEGNADITVTSPVMVSYGNEITLTAYANDGYGFKEWEVTGLDLEDDCNTETDGIIIFTVPDNAVTVTAVFEQQTKTLTMESASDDNGLDDSDVTLTGAGDHAVGTEVSINATTTDENYRFDRWTAASDDGDEDEEEAYAENFGNAKSAQTVFTMPDDDVTLTAHFVKREAGELAITYAITGTGSVSATITDTDGETASVPKEGYSVSLTPSPGTGYILEGTLSVKTSDGDPVTLTNNTFEMPSKDVVVSATFVLDSYTITIKAVDEDGDDVTETTASNYSSDSVGNQMNSTITLAPGTATGYSFKNWSSTTTGVSIVNSQFVMPPRNVTVTANYEANRYNVSVTSATNGRVTVNDATPPQLLAYNTDVTLEAIPDSGYEFVSWSIDGVTAEEDGATATFKMPANAVAIQATFALSAVTTHTVTVNAAPAAGGTAVKASPAGDPAEGSTVTITATANSGYTFSGWTVNSGGVTLANAAEATTTFTMGTADVEITASFTSNDAPTHTVTVNADPAAGGTAVKTSPAGDPAEGSTVTITATANSGYTFSGWTVNSGGVTLTNAAEATTTFTMGTANVEVTASFISNDAPTHTVALNAAPAAGGTAVKTSPAGDPAEGSTVTITATANSGYTFSGWSVNSGGVTLANAAAATTTFTMGTADVTLTANFSDTVTEETFYNLSVASGGNGTAELSVATGVWVTGPVSVSNIGTMVAQLRAVPNEGFEFAGWSVTAGNATINSAASANTSVGNVRANTIVTASFRASGTGPTPQPVTPPTTPPGSDGGSSGGGGEPDPTPEPPAVDQKAADAASILGLPAQNGWLNIGMTSGTNTSNRKVEVKLLTQTGLLERFEREATTLLLGLNTITKDANGKDYVRVYAAFDVNVTAPAGGSVVANFKVNRLTFGNKFIAFIKHKDGTTSYGPVDVDFKDGKISVRLPATAANVVIIEFRLVRTRAVGNLRLTASQQRRVFDAAYYAAQNPDVVRVFGTDPDALYRHFIRYGLREGRAGNERFDITFYRLNNPDLQQLYGNDTAKYIQHYLKNGRKEGRMAGIRGGRAR